MFFLGNYLPLCYFTLSNAIVKGESLDGKE